jgi:hypothetical protein
VVFAPCGKPRRGDEFFLAFAEFVYFDMPCWITCQCGTLTCRPVISNGERQELGFGFGAWIGDIDCLTTLDHARMTFDDLGAIGDNGRLSDHIPGAKKRHVLIFGLRFIGGRTLTLRIQFFPIVPQVASLTDTLYLCLSKASSSSTHMFTGLRRDVPSPKSIRDHI